MLMASSMGTQKARDLKSGSGSFDIDEFVRKLVRFMGGAALADMPVEEEGEDELTDEPMDWEKIGRKALAKSNRVPVTSFMCVTSNKCRSSLVLILPFQVRTTICRAEEEGSCKTCQIREEQR